MKHIILLFVFLLSFASAQFAQQDASAAQSPVREHEILEKPRAPYTDSARQNGVEGLVRLRVTLLANGQVGQVTPLTYLPHGLTQQAMNSARNIKFRPKSVNGKPVDVIITVEYRFTLYYENADSDITTKVAILSMPNPEIKRNELSPESEGRIAVEVFFGADGRVSVFRYVSPLTQEQKQRVEEAVGKIKFRSAIHKSGKRMSVTKVIDYEVE